MDEEPDIENFNCHVETLPAMLGLTTPNSIPANPLKDGDAKLLVYGQDAYDSRAAQSGGLQKNRFFSIAIAPPQRCS